MKLDKLLESDEISTKATFRFCMVIQDFLLKSYPNLKTEIVSVNEIGCLQRGVKWIVANKFFIFRIVIPDPGEADAKVFLRLSTKNLEEQSLLSSIPLKDCNFFQSDEISFNIPFWIALTLNDHSTVGYIKPWLKKVNREAE